MKDSKENLEKLGYELPRLVELSLGNVAFGAGPSEGTDDRDPVYGSDGTGGEG